jgi:hypothetical protein
MALENRKWIAQHIMLRDLLTQKWGQTFLITDFGYPRPCRFRKYQNLNRSPALVVPTFFKMWFKFIICGQNGPNLDKIGQNWPIFELFRQFFTFFSSWITPQTVLNEFNKKMRLFQKNRKIPLLFNFCQF